MKKLLTCLLALLTGFCPGQIKLSKGKLINHRYTDTIPVKNKFGLKVIVTEISGKKWPLIFDTGADITVMKNDSSKLEGVSGKILDGYGKTSKASIVLIKALTISKLNYVDLSAFSVELPAPLLCLGEGIMGNNINVKSNWQITDQYLVASNKPFKVDKKHLFKCFYYGSFRLFSNLSFGETGYDSCLVDYGGRFEIRLPYNCYERFVANKQIKCHRTIKRTASTWTINGRLPADTLLIVNCGLDFCGFYLDSVNVSFSKQHKMCEIGALLLNRFSKVYINNGAGRLGFESPVRPKGRDLYEIPFSFEMEKDSLFISGMNIDGKPEYSIKTGDKVISINDKGFSDFSSYCEFLNWIQHLNMKNGISIRMENSQMFNVR